MLELKTGRGNLVLDTKTRIRFTYLFPLFVTDAIPNMVSYPFDLPDDQNGINRLIIGATPAIDTPKKVRTLGLSVIFDGDEKDSGTLICIGLNNGVFRCMFYSTPFAEGFDSKQMHELSGLLTAIVLGETAANIAAMAKTLSCKVYPHTDVVFPTVYAPDFYGETNKDFLGLLNNTNSSEAYIINQIVKEWEEGDPEEGDYETNKNSLLPAFFHRSIIREIFKSQGYKVVGNFFTNPKTKNAVMLGLKAADRTEYTAWVDASITGYTDQENGDRLLTSSSFQKGVNIAYSGGKATSSNKGYYEVSVEGLVVEYVQNLHILYLTIDFNGGEKTETKTINPGGETISDIELTARFWHDGSAPKSISVIINQNYQPVSGKITIRNASLNSLNQFAKSISIGESFKGIDVSAMVNAIRQMWGLVLFIDKQRNVIQVELAADLIKNAQSTDITKWVISKPEKEFTDRKKYTVAYDWNDTDLMKPLNKINIKEYINSFTLPIPSKSSIVKILNQFRYFTAEEKDDGTYKWKEDVTFIKDVTTPGIDKENYKPALQSLVSHNAGVPTEQLNCKRVMPYLPGEGKSDAFGNENEMKLTVVNYHGFNGVDSDGNEYPYASISNLSNLGVKNAAIQSLRFDGDDGLYKNVLKPLLDLAGNHETITYDIFPCKESVNAIINQFKPVVPGEKEPARNVMVKGVDFWVKQFDFEVTTHSIISAQVKLAKQKYEY